MSKIPCKKCPECGLFHDLSVDTCSECGKQIKNVPSLIAETDEIPAELFGEIDENITFFVQKCSACGALNFTPNKDKAVKVCFNCHKTRVASIEPVEYLLDNQEKNIEESMNSDVAAEIEMSNQSLIRKNQATIIIDNSNNKDEVDNANDEEDEEDEEDDDDSGHWQSILGNIKSAINTKSLHESSNVSINDDNSKKVSAVNYDNQDSDEDDIADWSGILGVTGNSQIDKPDRPKINITFSAIRYGSLSFTINASSKGSYLLGRSANQSEFLSKDGRVGNEHCYIIYKDGLWYVKDNHSANGTAVNSKDIGLDGEQVLNDGDELKLGHHPDSMAFKITISN